MATVDVTSIALTIYIGGIVYMVVSIAVQARKFYKQQRQKAASQEGKSSVQG
jgi:hypothetical protein